MDAQAYKVLCERFADRIMSDALGRGTSGEAEATAFLHNASGVEQAISLQFHDGSGMEYLSAPANLPYLLRDIEGPALVLSAITFLKAKLEAYNA